MWVIEEVPAIPDDLSLLLGDIIHNLRCALDHAWWQLAIVHLHRTPTEAEATRIQFPIRRPGKDFNRDTASDQVGKRAVSLIKNAQPPKAWQITDRMGPPDFLPPALGALRHLSNVDKHRELHLTYLIMDAVEVRNPMSSRFTNCTPNRTHTADGSGHIELPDATLTPEAGTDTFKFYVDATGPNPDVDWDPTVMISTAVEPHWRLLPLLDSIVTTVDGILKPFEPIFSRTP